MVILRVAVLRQTATAHATVPAMNKLKLWMQAASTAEQEDLAKRVSTSRAYLYHLAADAGSPYRREPKPILAAQIERETVRMAAKTAGRLPIVYRTDLVSACHQCEFARKCLGAKVIGKP